MPLEFPPYALRADLTNDQAPVSVLLVEPLHRAVRALVGDVGDELGRSESRIRTRQSSDELQRDRRALVLVMNGRDLELR